MFFTSRNKQIEENVKRIEDIEKNIINFNSENKELLAIITARENALNKIIQEKSTAFPWLAEAIANFHEYQDLEIVNYLQTKKHPAFKKADSIKKIAAENKVLRKQIKIAQNFVLYYETLFPWITEYVGEDLDELLEILNKDEYADTEDEFDPVLKFIPKAEYEKLSTSERNQKALDRYISTKKKPFEIGRDYERYIGYLYEKEGYKVEYIGIEKGFEDLGRDLICMRGEITEIVQCKYWASHKTIHEKHINQLYGTTIKYCIDNKDIQRKNNSLIMFPELISAGKVNATFITSTKLSDTARLFADTLGIKVIEEKPLEKYPLIKCNISKNSDKIYHLPFDQQYDKTRIKNAGEMYALTVEEAESNGFRRAFRWKGGSPV